MDYLSITRNRQSCRSYDKSKDIEEYKVNSILEAARLAPSACNGQPYHITICTGAAASAVAEGVMSMGRNQFASNVPMFIVISEKPYVKHAAIGRILTNNDYRSMDIGILASHITAEATEQGLASCILGWFDGYKIRKSCHIDSKIRLVIAVGYPTEGYELRSKKRRDINYLVTKEDDLPSEEEVKENVLYKLWDAIKQR